MNPIPIKNTSSKNALTEAEIDRLSGHLEALPETDNVISLEGLDGLVAAVAVMVRTVTVEELWPLLWEDGSAAQALAALGEPAYTDLAQLLLRRVNHTERLLSHSDISDLSDPRAYHPWVIDAALAAQSDAELAALLDSGELPELGFEWALGFISTVEHFAIDWRLEDELLDDELNPMISPFYALALPREEWPEDIREQDVAGNTREAWLAQAIWACYELWEYWRHHAPRPKGVTIVKEAMPGRNEPCHCGSGKKFKVCHG